VALNPGDVGGEEVDAVAVEVAAGTVVVLGSAGIGVPGQDLGKPPGPGPRARSGHGGRLVALSDQVQDAVSAQGVLVVPDP
jgi:hypothetical protein